VTTDYRSIRGGEEAKGKSADGGMERGLTKVESWHQGTNYLTAFDRGPIGGTKAGKISRNKKKGGGKVCVPSFCFYILLEAKAVQKEGGRGKVGFHERIGDPLSITQSSMGTTGKGSPKKNQGFVCLFLLHSTHFKQGGSETRTLSGKGSATRSAAFYC